ncbi:hypothetical protein RHIZ404_200670 [Rhizobium sp. EC-SD404]|nr:hypothetical protein RHIZ404_200670 [Rhizobium sp. EC-SD404]
MRRGLWCGRHSVGPMTDASRTRNAGNVREIAGGRKRRLARIFIANLTLGLLDKIRMLREAEY